MTPYGPIAASCDHHYEARILGGHPLSVRICQFCRTPDWADLAEQADNLYRWGHAEALAGKPVRQQLSAYDKPNLDAPAPDDPTGFYAHLRGQGRRVGQQGRQGSRRR